MRVELKRLLTQPLVARGISVKYLTSGIGAGAGLGSGGSRATGLVDELLSATSECDPSHYQSFYLYFYPDEEPRPCRAKAQDEVFVVGKEPV